MHPQYPGQRFIPVHPLRHQSISSHTAGSSGGLVKKIIYYSNLSFSESQDLSGVGASDFHFDTIRSGAVGLGFPLWNQHHGMILFEAPCSPKIPRFSPPTPLALTTSPALSIPKVQGSSSSLRQPESSLETNCRNGLCLVPLLSDGSGHLATLLDFRGLSFHCLSSLWQYLFFFLNKRGQEQGHWQLPLVASGPRPGTVAQMFPDYLCSIFQQISHM